jgi:hypothetical protein
VALKVKLPGAMETAFAVGLVSVIVGGNALGVTLFDAPEAVPVPAILVAFTVNVYAVVGLSPLTEQGDAEHVPAIPPGLESAL